MSKELEKLKEIGAQKISEQTHIARVHIQAVIHESFEDLTKIQFLGFVSILEREYSIDLSELKSHGLEYFSEENYSLKKDMFQSPKRKQRSFPIILTFILLIIAVALYYGYISHDISQKEFASVEKIKVKTVEKQGADVNAEVNGSDDVQTLEPQEIQAPEVNATKIEPVKKVVDKAVTAQATEPAKIEDKAVVVQVTEPVKIEAKAVEKKSLKLVTTQKLWVGFIDATTNTKRQKIITRAFALNPSKTWLLTLGHGNVDVYVNGKKNRFRSPKHLYLLYKNNILKQVNSREFKKLNRGRLW